LKSTIRHEWKSLPNEVPIYFAEHHQSHAASAFFPSPFNEAAILTVDGVGEWATTTICSAEGHKITPIKEMHFPHSIGLLYSAFTAYCGFRINSGEYKLMGLAPYGEPRYVQRIYDELIDLKEDGSFELNMRYFSFLRNFKMTNRYFDRMFDGPMRTSDEPIDQRHMDIARSIQVVTEEVMMRLAYEAKKVTGARNLCLAGGVALNCVANGRIAREGIFEDVWIQPAAGDAGGALGAALAYHYKDNERVITTADQMAGAFLGPSYTEDEIEKCLKMHKAIYEKMSFSDLVEKVADLIADDCVVGWFQGRMEFGPRALGHRSILADPRSPSMQRKLNLKIKYRESFRPFAPAVLEERMSDYFDHIGLSPYMLMVAPVNRSLWVELNEKEDGLAKLNQVRSSLPAITHVDHSARIQSVNGEDNPEFYHLLKRFEEKTGCGVLINTSFNVRGEPIVCTPDDAYRCLVNTEMDYLAVGNFLIKRTDQPTEHLSQTFTDLGD
jgi:carbamoyltransferase